MTKYTSKTIAFAVIVGLVAGLTGCESGCGSGTRAETPTSTGNGSILIVGQPQDMMVLEGSNAVFTVYVSAPEAMFQWQCQGTNLPGKNASQLVITNVDDSKLGLYSCLVTSGKESVSSHQVALFSFSVNSVGILSSVQGPLRPYHGPGCPCDNGTVEVNGICRILTNNSPWFPANGKTNCTADTFDASDYLYDTVLTATARFPSPVPNPSCNDDSPQAPTGHIHLSRLSFQVQPNGFYSFTIYTKSTPPSPAPILKLNVNWLP